MLLVLHAESVHASVQTHRPDQRMHVGRRCPPNHQFAIQPHIEAVVARAVQFDFGRFGRVPVAGPARAEESPGQVGVVVQEVEGDRGADVVEERCTVEADSGEYLPADACPVRRDGAEDEQERGQRGGHGDGAPSQAAKPLPVEPGKMKSYGHGSLLGTDPGRQELERNDEPFSEYCPDIPQGNAGTMSVEAAHE